MSIITNKQIIPFTLFAPRKYNIILRFYKNFYILYSYEKKERYPETSDSNRKRNNNYLIMILDFH